MATRFALEVDASSDCAYIRLTDEEVAKTVEVDDLVLIDLDKFGVVVGVEVLSLSADIPFSILKHEFHVHSEVIQKLQNIRPTVASFMSFQVGSDGQSASTSSLATKSHMLPA